MIKVLLRLIIPIFPLLILLEANSLYFADYSYGEVATTTLSASAIMSVRQVSPPVLKDGLPAPYIPNISISARVPTNPTPIALATPPQPSPQHTSPPPPPQATSSTPSITPPPPPNNPPTSQPTGVLFQEDFENADFSSRGWYDTVNLVLSSSEHVAGSTRSAEFHFLPGAATPTSGGAIRHKFDSSDSLYVSYYVKYSPNWVGSQKPYHPHEFLVMSNKDGDWDGPSYTWMTLYIEANYQNGGEPILAIQDSKSINTLLGALPTNILSLTNDRSVGGCNGPVENGLNPDCYDAPPWTNNKQLRGPVTFQPNPGQGYKGDWNHVEAYFKLNSIVNGVAQADGVMQYWFNGSLVLDRHDITFRTVSRADLKLNQFMIAPYIGDGSPVDQTMWVDNLTVATARGFATALPPPPPPPQTSTTTSATTTPLIDINGTVGSLLASDTSWQILWNDNKYGSVESGVWQLKYPAGFVGGSAPATLVRPLPNRQNAFVSLDWKANADWQGHKSNVNKLEFLFFDGSVDNGQGGDLYLTVYGTPGGPYDLRVNPQFRNGDTNRGWLVPNVSPGQITFGNWYHIEWQAIPNTSTTTPNGVIKWWLDGQLVGDYEDILFPVEPLIEYKLSPTWGGGDDAKVKDDYFWFNNIVVR